MMATHSPYAHRMRTRVGLVLSVASLWVVPSNITLACETSTVAETASSRRSVSFFSRTQESDLCTLPRRDYLSVGGQFVFDSAATRLIGIQVEDGESQLDGRSVDGVAITKVWPDSPAALAGLKGWHSVQMVKIVHLEIYDLIIAIDGGRVRDIFDLDDSLHDLKPGDIVYFTIVRDCRREQISVSLPTANWATTRSEGAQ